MGILDLLRGKAPREQFAERVTRGAAGVPREGGRAEMIKDLIASLRDRQFATWCEWEEGAPVLLPKADLVVLKRRSGEEIVRAWNIVERACGLVPETGMYPPRYAAAAWPEAKQWAGIQAAGDDPREIVLAGNFG
jgi:hypothetical protein